MIELAPNSKRGLVLRGPVILAGGYGAEVEERLLKRAHALVTNPTTLRPRALPLAAKRVEEFAGGFLLARSSANPGLARVLRARRHAWRRLDIPIILALAAEDISHWRDIAARASRYDAISALELELVEEIDIGGAIAAVKEITQLPILAKVTLERAAEAAVESAEAGADAIVVGLAPRGELVREGQVWRGRMFGASVYPLALKALREVVTVLPEVPVIAAGGVQTSGDVRAFLEAGAQAVEIDSILWRDPAALLQIAGETRGS